MFPVALWQQGTSDLSFVVSFHIIHGLPPASICISFSFLPWPTAIPSSYLSFVSPPISLNPLSACFTCPLLPKNIHSRCRAVAVECYCAPIKKDTENSLTQKLRTHTPQIQVYSENQFFDTSKWQQWWAPTMSSSNGHTDFIKLTDKNCWYVRRHNTFNIQR